MRFGIHKASREISLIGSERYHLGEAAPLIIAKYEVIAGFLIQFQKIREEFAMKRQSLRQGIEADYRDWLPGGSSKNLSSSIYTARKSYDKCILAV